MLIEHSFESPYTLVIKLKPEEDEDLDKLNDMHWVINTSIEYALNITLEKKPIKLIQDPIYDTDGNLKLSIQMAPLNELSSL